MVFGESGWVRYGYDIAVDVNISSNRKEVTCPVGGECAGCAPQGEIIRLDVEGNLKSHLQQCVKKFYHVKFEKNADYH